MSLEIKYLPQQYRTVYNPVEIVLYETVSATRNYSGFAYLVDVKDGSTTIGRLRVPPTTNGYGRFDLSGIMESYMSSDLGLLNGTNINTIYDNTNSYKDFTLEFGWVHYNTGSATYDIPQTVTFPDTTTATSYDLFVFNASLPKYRREVVNFYDWQSLNYFRNYTANTVDRNFLTNSPSGISINNSYNQKVMSTDEGYIYALYDHVNFPLVSIGVTILDISGSTRNVILSPPTGLASLKHLRIPSAPATLNKINPLSINTTQPMIGTEDIAYKIYLTDSTGVASKEFFYNIETECRYEHRRLEFLNSLGGFDYFNFTKVSRHSEEIERKFFQTTPNDLTSTGSINYSISNREKVQYYTKSMPKLKLTSDWIDYNTYNWLLELIESPEVYLMDSYTTPTGTTEIRRIPVKNINGNWEEKTNNADKLFNLEIDLEFGMDNFRQRF
tara:strand:+ start:971 stop:2299 length:1329 start_codon:yes stop_codon:yes gene_type:complete